MQAEQFALLGQAVGLGAMLLGVLGLTVEFAARSRAWRALPVWCLPLGCLPFLLSSEFRTIPGLWLALPALALLCGGCYALRSPVVARLAGAVGRPCVQWVGLALLGGVVFGATYLLPDAEDAAARVLESMIPQLVDDTNLHAVESVHAVTDRGRPVPVYVAAVETLPPGQLLDYEKVMFTLPHLAQQLIRLAPPDLSYNCHGWTFLGGQYWLRGRDVALVLADNGYEPVTTPRPGDIAVYRNSGGELTHSAVVRGVTTDGQVLLESKWGWGSRFIHPAQAQSYGPEWTYYRTERPDGNRVRFLVEPPEVPVPRVAG